MRSPELKQQFQRVCNLCAGALRNGFAIVGFVAVVLVLAEGGKFLPQSARAAQAAVGAAQDAAIQDAMVNQAQATEAPPTDSRYKVLADFLSHRYKVASDATEHMVDAAYQAAHATGLDPLLILAVMGIESRFNPIAQSEMGAKGLMQIMPVHHQDEFDEVGGDDAVLDPAKNILVGARILKQYIRLAGSPEAGLQMYAGAATDPDSQYAQKVLAEKGRLVAALKQKRDKPSTTAVAAAS